MRELLRRDTNLTLHFRAPKIEGMAGSSTLVQIELAQGEQRRPDFLRLNPFARVPVLVDEDVTIYDSTIIAECFLMPGWDLFFGSPDAIKGAARPLVERAARALGYNVVEG